MIAAPDGHGGYYTGTVSDRTIGSNGSVNEIITVGNTSSTTNPGQTQTLVIGNPVGGTAPKPSVSGATTAEATIAGIPTVYIIFGVIAVIVIVVLLAKKKYGK